MESSQTAAIEPQFRTIDGLRIRYAASGGTNEPVMLLTSPWPESIYAFAPMWETLAKHARLFAIDLPGFGTSERRTDLLSPRTMGEFLARLITEADLGKPHIVGPDVGTAAALFAAAADPERIASVTVGTGGAAVPIQLGEPLRSWVLEPDLDKYRRMDPRALVNTAVDTIAGGVPDYVRADYLASYDGDRFVESMRYVRSYPEQLPDACRGSATDRDAGHDHQRPPRPRRAARERGVPRRTAPQQPPRDHRRWPLRLGRGANGVCLDHPRLDLALRLMTSGSLPGRGRPSRTVLG